MTTLRVSDAAAPSIQIPPLEFAEPGAQSLPSGVAVWTVRQGSVDLFIDHAKGRTFAFTVLQGDRFFGLPANARGTFRVVGAEGALVSPASEDEADSKGLGAAADRWIGKLAVCLTDATPQPALTTSLQPGDRVDVKQGDTLAAAKAPVWIVVPAGGCVRVLGTELDIEGPVSLPLSGGMRLLAVEAGPVSAATSHELAEAAGLIDAMMAFNARLPTLLEGLSETAAAATLARIGEARTASDRQVRSSLEALDRSTLSAGTRFQATPTTGPAPAALAHALDRLGCSFDAKRLTGMGADLADIPSLARRVGVRTRRVLLRPDWHKQDLGILISAHGEDRSPIALMPNTRGSYDVFDPEQGTVANVGPDANRIGPTAYGLYRPLSQSRLRLADLAGFVWRDIRADGLTAIFAGGAVGLLGALLPIMAAVIVDAVVPSGNLPLLTQLGIALVLIAALSFAFSATRDIALHRIDGRTAAALQAALWDRLLRLPLPFFRRFSAGDLAQRVAGMEAVRRALVDLAMRASIAFAFSLFNVVLLFVFAPSVASLAVILVLGLAFLTAIAASMQLRYARQIAEVEGQLSGLVIQYLQGVAKLRVAGAESRAFAKWAERYAEERRARVRLGRLRNRHESFSSAYEILALLVLFAAMSALAPTELSVGVFIAFLMAFGAFQSAFLGFAKSSIALLSVLPQLERGRPLLDAQLETEAHKIDPGPLKGGIQVSGLVFSYSADGQPLFDGLDLDIRPGQRIALVGKSGAGKSSLIRLLLGFERPQAGAILYDGQNLESLDLSQLRRQIGVVLQTGRVFGGSILDNIRGSNDLSLDRCLEAAQAAGLEGDLARMPMGLHTPLTEGAATLSGGQRQRILIARALAARPRLLFLDEATSALDNRTQKIVTETLDRTGATSIVVAHRLSTVRTADKICVIDQGRVQEQGSFDELMALDGRFAELASRQLL
ncbi:MAG: NHLP bacteriocin export ABC transporter permease/ATPase subunit [Pseudomonadota bacterium]